MVGFLSRTNSNIFRLRDISSILNYTGDNLTYRHPVGSREILFSSSHLISNIDVYPAFSLVELLHCCALIGRELHVLKGPTIGALSDATPALLCHKEPARASKAPY